MSLLDRLRGQPGWRHEDPSVRAAAVDDLENDAQDLFEAIASEDADTGVRLAALARLSDPAAIGRIARAAADAQVRDEAVSTLRAMAVEAADPDAGAAALVGLSEARDLAEVARSARSESVSRSALTRLESQKAIGAVARRSAHRGVREAALARLDARDELVAVAVKTDHREVALAAFDRLAPLAPADRDHLRAIAVRARTKQVSRRAKTALAELDARPVPPTPDELRRRRGELCERVEALAEAQEWETVSAGLDEAERDWRALEAGGAPTAGAPAAAEASAAGEAPSAVKAPAEGAEGEAPSAIEAPAGEEAPSAAGAPGEGAAGEAPSAVEAPAVAGEAPSAVEASAAEEEAPSGGAPVAGEAPSAVGAGEAPSAVEAPAGEEAPSAVEAPAVAGEAPSAVEASAAEEEAPSGGAPAGEEAPSAVGAPGEGAGEEVPSAVGAPGEGAGEEAPSAVGAPGEGAGEEAPSAVEAPAGEEAPSAVGAVGAPSVVEAPVAGEAPSAVGAVGAVEAPSAVEAPAAEAPSAVGAGEAGEAPSVVAASGAAETPSADAAVAERWRVALAAGLDHLARLDAARQAAARRRGDALAARVALCDRLTALAADDARDADALAAELEVVRAEWTALPEMPPADDGAAAGGPAGGDAPGQVERRFADLVAAAGRQAERRRTAAARVARLTALVDTLEAVSATPDVEKLTTGWKEPHREWTALVREATAAEVAELAPRAAAAEQKRGDRLIAAREARRRREQANLAKQQARCDEIERALADEQLELKDAEHFLRLTRSLLGNLGRLPGRQDRETLTNRLRAAQTGLTGRVRELRGLVEWKQWANVGVRTALCQRLEALAAGGEKEDEAFAREFRRIMNEWRQASDGARDEESDEWRRFKAAHDAAYPRFEAHQAAQDAVRGENLAKKVALCEEAERLAESTAWIEVAQRMTELQEQWKQVGSATRKAEREVWNRFRAASGHFFRRRRQDLAERKQVWSKNAQSKEELCAKAEALAEETDLEAAKAAVRRLQDEWKTVGPVRRSRSEALWQRFRAACDRVYARAREVVDAPYAENVRARAAVCERLETLAPDGDGAEPPPDLAPAVAAARGEWRALEPLPRPQERGLTARFDAALSRLVDRFPGAFAGTDLDPARNAPALERLCERVEALVREDDGAPAADARSPSEILAARLREALASNTMGARADAEVRRREEAETVKRLQAERRALGVVPGEAGRRLSDRFRAACDRFFQLNPLPPPSSAGGRPPRGGSSRAGGSSRRRRG